MTTKKLMLLIFTSLSTLSLEVNACSCLSLGRNFFETMSLEFSRQNPSSPESPAEPIVILGKVVRYIPFAGRDFPTEMEVQVEYVLNGKTNSRKIIVEGDNGALCRPYLTQFKVGSAYMFGLKKISESKHYEISICGHYWLKAKKP